jgi:hypothetical protein
MTILSPSTSILSPLKPPLRGNLLQHFHQPDRSGVNRSEVLPRVRGSAARHGRSHLHYPEARGHTLEQMAVLLDGDDAGTSPSAYLDGKDCKNIHVAENKGNAGDAEKGH